MLTEKVELIHSRNKYLQSADKVLAAGDVLLKDADARQTLVSSRDFQGVLTTKATWDSYVELVESCYKYARHFFALQLALPVKPFLQGNGTFL